MPTLVALAKLIGVSDTLIENATEGTMPPRPEPGTETSVKRAAKDYHLDVTTLWRWVRRGDMGITVIREPEGKGAPLIIDASTVWPIAKQYHEGRSGKGRRTAVQFATNRANGHPAPGASEREDRHPIDIDDARRAASGRSIPA